MSCPTTTIFLELAEALIQVGFNVADTNKILGGNYARVFAACMA